MAVYDDYGRTDNITALDALLPYLALNGAGPPQGTKRDRGTSPAGWNSNSEPWGGPVDSVAMRSPNMPSTALPPSLYGATAAYAPDPATIARSRDANGNYSDPLVTATAAELAIAAALSPPRMPMNKPAFVHPGIQQALAIGKAYTPSPKVQAAIAAPPPQQSAANVIAQALSGGHNTSSPAAFAADVTRPSNMPGVEQFTGTVQQGQGGQNRYGSTARNELLALYT